MTTTATTPGDISMMLPVIGRKKKSRNKKSKGTVASTVNVNRKEGLSTGDPPNKKKPADIDTQRAIADDNESLKHPAVDVSPTAVSDTGDVVASTQVVAQRDVPEEVPEEEAAPEKEEAKEDGNNSNEHQNGSATTAPSQTEGSAESGSATTTNDSTKTVETIVEERVATTVDTSATHDDASATDDDVTDLSNPRRRIWVVTTAAMPWRTGTAVNPLMRALYLTRGRPKHYVTLVVPWLADVASQEKLFGANHVFTDEKSQEEWIRDFCRTRAECPEEESNLRIAFYPSAYHSALGSIFPSVDICSLIPDDEADVAILEEPEHLNWIRYPPSTKKDAEGKPESILTCNLGVEVEDGSEPQVVVEPKEGEDNKHEKYGWAQKFRYVVGILHTNYAAYMGQFGFGTSMITAPALSLLSSIVVRAYCHRVIRLSAALPPLAPNKEVTSNVHGVRSEFLESPSFNSASGSLDISQKPFASVYFIGKVIWAKGFESVLEVQELYRQKTGEYFPIDIYGGGPDEKAIRRAFFGRRKKTSQEPSPEIPRSPGEYQVLASKVFGSTESIRGLLLQAKQAFTSALEELEYGGDDSISDDDAEEGIEVTDYNSRDSANPFSVLGELPEKSVSTGLAASKAVYKLANDLIKEGMNRTEDESEEKEDEPDRSVVDQEGKSKEKANPLSVLSDLPMKSVSTGLAASKAVYKLADNLVQAGMDMTFDKEVPKDGDNNGSFVFSPPKSRFEWRRNPIPARFCGIKDHVELRDMVDHKIFLNMSVTEVLCTTTAEALAMGKFVILPDHPSNEFFLQFFNCLAYKTEEECVEKLKWALTHDPKPLSDDEIHAFSWEGATERLFEASRMTAEEQKRNMADKDDHGVARMHVESMKKGHFLKKFLAREN